MYGGRIVESGPVREVFTNPRHRYTQGLIAASNLTAVDERGRDGADARVVTARLTASGRDRFSAARARRIGFLTDRFANLTDAERAAVTAALPALEKLLSAEPPAP